MTIASTTGAKIYIGPAHTTANSLLAYEALAYTEIGDVESLGEFGGASAGVTYNSIVDGSVRKLKGPRDAGDLAVVVANNPEDAGQAAAIVAEVARSTFAFKVVLPEGTGISSVFYFRALVMSARLSVGGANGIIRRTFPLAINSPLIPTTEATSVTPDAGQDGGGSIVTPPGFGIVTDEGEALLIIEVQ